MYYKKNKAVGGNRTRILGWGSQHNNHYTTTAYGNNTKFISKNQGNSAKISKSKNKIKKEEGMCYRKIIRP